jgi:hypothetical protein
MPGNVKSDDRLPLLRPIRAALLDLVPALLTVRHEARARDQPAAAVALSSLSRGRHEGIPRARRGPAGWGRLTARLVARGTPARPGRNRVILTRPDLPDL